MIPVMQDDQAAALVRWQVEFSLRRAYDLTLAHPTGAASDDRFGHLLDLIRKRQSLGPRPS